MRHLKQLTQFFAIVLLFITLFSFQSYADACSCNSDVTDPKELEKNIVAQEKAWDILNTYADPDYFLVEPDEFITPMTEDMVNTLHSEAVKVTAGCNTQYDKIKAIYEYVHNRIEYTFPNYYNPYETWYYQEGACSNYADLTRSMLITLEIPCMILYGDCHAYNAAYDSDNNRWIFIDSTNAAFDSPSNYRGKKTMWDVYGIDGLISDGVYYSLYTGIDEGGKWNDMEWEIQTQGVKSKGKTTYKIISNMKGIPLRKIGDDTFYKCNKMKSITIPNGVKVIGDGAFGNCSSLKHIDIPQSVKKVEYAAFASTGFEKIDFSNTKITSMDGRTFYDCKKLVEVKLSNTLTEIGSYSFEDCTKLKLVDLSNTKLTAIEMQFHGANNLEEVRFPNTLTTVGKLLFSFGADNMKSVDLSNTKVTTIEKWAFINCSSLTNVKLPDTLKSIGEYAFSGTNINKMDLSNTKVTTIGDRAFSGCFNLEIIKFPSTLKTIGEGMCWYCKDLKEIKIQNTKIKVIADYAFSGCDSVDVITLPSTLESIGKCSFSTGENCEDGTTLICSKFSKDELYDMGYIMEGKSPWYPSFYGRTLYVTNKLYTVKYNANGGKISGDVNGYAGKNLAIGKLPSVSRKGYKFAGWYTSKTGGKHVYSSTVLSKNTTLYAHWVKVHTIKFNANGGTTGVAKKWVSNNKKIDFMPKPKRKGYKFKGWYTAKSGGKKVYSTTKITKDMTLYARWVKK